MDIFWKCIAAIIVISFIFLVSIFIIRLIHHRRKYGKFPEIVFETKGSESTKHDKTIEKWLKERNENELQMLHSLITDERIKDTFLLQAFQWTVKECKELSNLGAPISSTDSIDVINTKLHNKTDAQIVCILKYRESGICVRCKNPLSGIIKESHKKHEVDVYLADYLFLSVHELSGLCINCIGEFLLEHIKKFS